MPALDTRPSRFRDPWWSCGLVFLLSTLNAAPASATQPKLDPLSIVAGQSLSLTFGNSEAISYELETSDSSTYLIEVTQGGSDLVVTLDSPNGASISFDSPLRQDDSEFVLLENSDSGTYSITLQAQESPSSPGTHTITISSLDVDSPQLEAWRHMSDAAAANATGRRNNQEQALESYEAAAKQWNRVGNQAEQAHALYSAAMLSYLVTWEWHASNQLAAKAARLYAAVGNRELQANALLLQAMALTEAINESDKKEPILDSIAQHLEKSYDTHESLGNTAQLAKIQYFNGLSNQNAGRNEEAKLFYTKAATLFAQIDDWKQARKILLNNAVIDIDTGNSNNAIRALEKLHQQEKEENPDPDDVERNFVGTVLDQLGAAHEGSGNIDEALDAFSNARDIHHAASDLHGKAESLRGIARIYLSSGDVELARRFLTQAESAASASNNGRVLGIVQTTLGNIAYSESDYRSAAQYQTKALDLAPRDGPIRAYRQVLLARTHVALGEFKTAIELANEAYLSAGRAESPRTVADALQQIGNAYLGLQDPARSIASLERALTWYQNLKLTAGQADVKNALALAVAETASGSQDKTSLLTSLDDALMWSAQSIAHVDAMLGKVSVPELRAYYAATRRGYYQTHIDLLMERHKNADRAGGRFISEALTTSERARARMTMDLLNEASVDLQQAVNPDTAAKVRQYLNELEDLQEHKESILARGGIDDLTRDRVSTLSDRMALIRNQLDILQVDLRRSSKRYTTLTNPTTVSLAVIQDLLENESVLLQYSLGEHRSFVWIVTGDSVRAVQLADRATIDTAAQRAFHSLRAFDHSATGRKEQEDALWNISQLVLQPLAELIGNKRLIVVADGALNYLPFQVLSLERHGHVEPILDSREVVALPSMSVLAALRDQNRVQPPAKLLAVFADPVFEKTDPRIDKSELQLNQDVPSPKPDHIFLTRSSLSGYLPRLEGTLAEATAISELVPDHDTLVATGFRASRAEVLGQELGDYKYLHFATHGKVDSEVPALSALVLSRFDRYGEAQDGYLRLQDIYSLDVNAELVVLSACDTGLGTEIRGEGLIGLTQGFFYAGAQSLVVSLWSVPDRPTAELMTRFYRQIFNHGLSPAAALRHAQQSMASNRRWNDPYFWGAFILLGDWQ